MAQLKEGDIVVVTAKQDERIRDATSDALIGTLAQISKENCWVIFENGNIWVGPIHSVFAHDSSPSQPEGGSNV